MLLELAPFSHIAFTHQSSGPSTRSELQPHNCSFVLQAWQQQWESGGGGDDEARAAAALDEACRVVESLGEHFYPNDNRCEGVNCGIHTPSIFCLLQVVPAERRLHAVVTACCALPLADPVLQLADTSCVCPAYRHSFPAAHVLMRLEQAAAGSWPVHTGLTQDSGRVLQVGCGWCAWGCPGMGVGCGWCAKDALTWLH